MDYSPAADEDDALDHWMERTLSPFALRLCLRSFSASHEVTASAVRNIVPLNMNSSN